MRLRPLTLGTLLLTTLFLAVAGELHAQSKDKPVSKESRSWALEQQRKNAAIKDFPRQQYPRYIIITETKGVLYGNPCAVQETHRMGFEYVLMKKGQPGYEKGMKKLGNNLKVKTGLVFRKSPFWKLVLKKRIEDCRVNTGDFVGQVPGPARVDKTVSD